MPASRPRVPVDVWLRNFVLTDHDAEYDAWVSAVRRCHAYLPFYGWRPSHRSGPADRGRLLLQPAGCSERDIVSGGNRHPDDFPNDHRHPAADRPHATAPAAARLERLDQRPAFVPQDGQQLRGDSPQTP